MPEQPRHLANKYEDIVNLQGAGHIVEVTARNQWRIQDFWKGGRGRRVADGHEGSRV